jgi:hypothetical protein
MTGLVLARDPAISLFKPGYKALLIYNASPPGSDTTRVRPFWQDGETFALQPFQGTRQQWVVELREAAYPAEIRTASQHDPAQIRAVYLNRKRRVKAEVEKLPRELEGVDRLISRLDDSIQFLGAGGGQ